VASIRRVSPEQAQTLLAEGYTFVDVRSEPEYERGHVPGAYNVPIMHQGPSGMRPNPDFELVMERAFPKDARLIVGCRSGVRSSRAADVLSAAGFAEVVDLETGWDGSRDAFGRLCPGWAAKGLPAEAGQPEGRRYDDVRAKLEG
jgi:rhodanese-related sulfurtransferase